MMMKVIMQVQLSNQYIINQSNIKKKMICKQRNTLTKGEGQSSRHHNIESLIMEGNYFCILAYKHETDYNRSISQTRRYGYQWSHLQKADQPGLAEGGLGCKLAKLYREFLEQLPTLSKWLSAGLYRQEDKPSSPHQLNPKTQ